MQPGFLEFPETGKAQRGPENLLTVLPPLRAERGNMVWDCLQLADTGFGTNTCPCPLPVGHMAPGSMKQSIFFLTLDKSVYFCVCL